MKQKIKKMLFWAVLSAILLYGLVVAFLCLRIYVEFGRFDGNHKKEIINQQYKILKQIFHAKNFSVTTQDGLSLGGLLIQKRNAKKTLVVVHGFRATKELLLPIVTFLADEPINIVLFDLRAHGKSEGHYTSLGAHEQKDLRAIIDYIKNNPKLKNTKLYALGISMGGAAVLCVQSNNPVFSGLIIDSTFTNLRKQLIKSVTYHYPWFTFGLMPLALRCWEHIIGISLSQVQPLNCLKDVSVPILFMHAKADKIIPAFETEILFASYTGPKEIWLSNAKRHAELYLEYPDQYKHKILTFLRNN